MPIRRKILRVRRHPALERARDADGTGEKPHGGTHPAEHATHTGHTLVLLKRAYRPPTTKK